MYKIKLSDGTTLNRLELNGNNFISEDKLTDATFAGKLSYVEITDDDGYTMAYHDMILIWPAVPGNDTRTWFILSEKPEQQKKEETVWQTITDLEIAQIEQMQQMTDLEIEVMTNEQQSV